MGITPQVYITEELQKICPVDGLSFPDILDKNTWTIDFKEEATAEQKLFAENWLASFDMASIPTIIEQERIRLRDEAAKQDLSIVSGFVTAKAFNPVLTFSAYLDNLEVVQKSL